MNKVKVVQRFPLLGLMFLIMFALKLAGPMASVSWWIVTMPLWAPFALVFGILAFFGIVALFAMLFRK